MYNPLTMTPAASRLRHRALTTVGLLLVGACRARPAETRIVVVTATPAPVTARLDPTPEPSPSPALTEETAAFVVPVAPQPPPELSPGPPAEQKGPLSCVDQMAEVLPAAEPLIEDFRSEREIARSTPRLSLASQITRLRDLYRRTRELPWPDRSCAYRLEEKVLAAEENDLDVFTDFMGQRSIYPTRGLWPAVNKELAEMQSLVIATGATRGRRSE